MPKSLLDVNQAQIAVTVGKKLHKAAIKHGRSKAEISDAAHAPNTKDFTSMIDTKEPYVVVFEETKDGYEYRREGHTLQELGGTIPAVGDLLIDPGTFVSADLSDPSAYTLAEVIKRYFVPQSDPKYGARVYLVVRERKGLPEEIGLLYRS